MCSPRWFSRRGNHTLIWTSIVGNSVSSKRDNVLRSWPTRGFERVRLRKGHSKCYWNHAIFLRRTFTLIVIRCPFDTSDIDIYIYICRIRTYDGRLNPFLFVGLATVLLYCYLDMLNLYLTRSAIRPRGSCFSLGREIVFGKTTIFKRLGTKIYVYNTLEITPGFDIIWYRFRSFLNSKVFR